MSDLLKRISAAIKLHLDPDDAALAVLKVLATYPGVSYTHILAAMRVGDVVPARVIRSSVGLLKTNARQIMNNPDANWAWRTKAGEPFIQRLKDGEKVDPSTWLIGDGAKQMAAMAVGESFLGDPELFPIGRALATTRKRTARRRMGVPDADWISRQTTLGMRITRVK